VTVGVSADSAGNLTPLVESVAGSVAGRVVAQAAPEIVRAANDNAPAALVNKQARFG
jgi:hypothetical protein